MPVPIAALIAGGAAVASTAIGAWNARRNTNKTIAANKALAEQAFHRDAQQLDKMNEYNSPANQMQRYYAAGLNPNLIYGQGTPGNQTQTAKYQSPRIDYQYKPPVDPAAVISAYQDIAVKDAQVDNLNAQTRNVEARTLTEAINTRFMSSKQRREAALAERDVMYSQDLAELELRSRQQSLTNAQKTELSIDLRNQFQQYANQWAKYGVTGKDALLIRSGVKIMQQLGLDYSWLKDMLPAGTTIDDVLKMN